MPIAETGPATAGELASVERLWPRTRDRCGPVRAMLVRSWPAGHPVRIAKPCPFVRCQFHLHVDVEAEDIYYHPKAPIEHTCVLDVVEAIGDGHETVDVGPRRMDETGAGMSLAAIGEVLGLSHETVRSIETLARSRIANKMRRLR